MRVVVFGASGNLGTSVLSALVREPDVDRITGVARRLPRGSMPDVAWVAADVATDDLAPIVEGADAIVHLAWAIQPSRDPELLRRINVDGSRRVFEAAAKAGVRSIVYASSVGAYAPAEPGRREALVDETYPRSGIPSSIYSSQKAEVEGILDAFESSHPEIAVARMRPALIFKREAASEIRRLFAGPFLPSGILRAARPPVVPVPRGLRMQCVHADDAGRAFALALIRGARGAFNVAAEPQLTGADLAEAVGGKPIPVKPAIVRTLADLTWRARLQPTPAGWLDLAMEAPGMNSAKVRSELGWEETVSARDALRELIDGLAVNAGGPTPPLHPRAGGRFRLRELRTGVGARP